MNHIRLLRADEIECRTGIIRENGLSLLLYKDARVDQNILDEAFGLYGWKREHQVMEGKMFCTISIRDEDGNWVSKQDVGTESNSEPTKGAASDSFKRAAFNIGIGRELYTAPFIWIPSNTVRIERRGDRFITKDSFYVSDIQYNEKYRAISGLRICNQNGLAVYGIGLDYNQNQTKQDYTGLPAGRADWEQAFSADDRKKRGGNRAARSRKKKTVITEQQINELKKELERTGVDEFNVLQRYGIPELETMDEETYMRAMSGLQKTPTAA